MTGAKIPTPAGEVSLAVQGPTRPRELLVLGHGAGAGMDSDFMAFFADALTSDTRAVARFNFPYMEQGRSSPGAARASEEAFNDVLSHLRRELTPAQVVIGGKSYGGRIASQVAASGGGIDSLVFLGYPLHPPGRADKMRDEHLYGIDCPMLFVEGTRDPFCPLQTLEKVMERLQSAELLVVEDGDHSLKVRAASGRSTREAWAEAARGIATWLEETLSS